MFKLRRLGALALVAVFGIACSETPTANDIDTRPQLNRSAGPVVSSASGAWVINGVRVIAFTARLHADGTVRGQWERVNQPGRTNHGDVVCLTIIGNQAWIGTITRIGLQAGQEGGFRVIDNGEGANAATDQASLQFVNLGPGGAAAYCAAAAATPALFTVGAGNIQIK